MAKDKGKKERMKRYKEVSHDRFVLQRSKLIAPNLGYLAASWILFIILMIWDKPQVLFDESSKMFSILLLIICAVPVVSLIVIRLAVKTMHLLITITLHTLTVIPLIIGYWVKYDELKECSSYHMLIFYFLYFILFVVMTTVFNKIRKNYLNSAEEL